MTIIINSLEELSTFTDMVLNNNGNLTKAITDYKQSLCPVCNGLVETKQYWDCCSAYCYKAKHV